MVGASLAILAGLLLGEHPGRMALAGLILALPATATVSASAGDPARDRVSTSAARGVSTGWVGVRFGLAAGLGTAISLVASFLAVHAGALAVAAVVTSLFPVVTVGLAVAVARERLGAVRLVALILAAMSVSLIAAGGDS